MKYGNRSHDQIEQFEYDLTHPSVVSLAGSGHEYAVHQFNQDYLGERPLAVYLGLGTTALTSMGAAYLKEYCDAIKQPVITMQPVARRWSTLQERAESDALLLEMLARQDLDIVGSSSGGLLASYTASILGATARSLVTVSSVGTKKGYFDYVKGLPGQFATGVKESVSMLRSRDRVPIFGTSSSNFFNVAHYSDLAQTVRLSVGGSLGDAVGQLDHQTRWHDIVGTKDDMTRHLDHVDLVQNRNREAPGSSSIEVMEGEAHMWATKRTQLAEMVRQAISDTD